MEGAVQPACFDVTQIWMGAANLPGGGLPTSMRCAVTISPEARVKLAQGLGIRSKRICWMDWPVALFMMVAVIAIRAGR